MKFIRISVFFGILLSVVACAPNTVVNPTPIAAFEKSATLAPQKDYLIGVGDVLDIKFTYNPELNELAVPVRPDGRISLQLTADIQAANLTPNQLRGVLIEKYAAEIKKPEIAVIVRTFREKQGLCGWRSAVPGPG